MKTLFITCFNPFIARNILATDVFKILKEEKDLRLVVFVQPYKIDFLTREYGGKNVIFEGIDLDPTINSRFSKFWYRLAFLVQNSRYVRDQRREYFEKSRKIFTFPFFICLNFWSWLLSSFKLSRRLYRQFDFWFSPKNVFANFVEKYRPAAFFATDIFSEADAIFLRQARAFKVPTIGMVRSWDNPTTKGVLRVIPDKIIVNSPVIKEELIKFHDCRADYILISGLPQFDGWLEKPKISREEFFRDIGADLNKKLILFSPAGSALSDTDWQICQIFEKAIESNALPPNIQFLVRNHPHHPADLSRFSANKNFIIETPGLRLKSDDFKQAELRTDDNLHLMHSVYYCDVVVYVATSLGLDSAIFDKPQIIVSFDGWEKRPYHNSVKRYHFQDNILNLIKTGGVRVAEDQKSLINHLNNYLNDPSLDKGGRKNIIDQHLYKVDGQSGWRIADFILKFLDKISKNDPPSN